MKLKGNEGGRVAEVPSRIARVMGHQQVTDAYLLGLAIRRGGVLATLDQRIAALPSPKSVERTVLETVA